MLSSQKYNVTNYTDLPLSRQWSGDLLQQCMTFNFIVIFNVWGAIEVTFIGIFSLHSIGKTMAETGK